MNFLIALLPSIPFAILMCGSLLAGCLVGWGLKCRAQYHAGRVAGMREEKSFTNSRVITATISAYHEGVITERNRHDILAAGCTAASRN